MDIKLKQISEWLGNGSINIFGKPFAGKDTQAENLAELFDGVVIGGGEILRSQAIPAEVQAELDQGKLAPTDYYLKTMVPYLSRPEISTKPLFLSSVGRWHGEEPTIIKGTEEAGHKLKAVVHLNMSDEEALKRLEVSKTTQDRGHRNDDNQKVIENRLEEYRLKTLPVIDYYKNLGLLIEVDGSKSRQEVTEEILDQLHNLAKN